MARITPEFVGLLICLVLVHLAVDTACGQDIHKEVLSNSNLSGTEIVVYRLCFYLSFYSLAIGDCRHYIDVCDHIGYFNYYFMLLLLLQRQRYVTSSVSRYLAYNYPLPDHPEHDDDSTKSRSDVERSLIETDSMPGPQDRICELRIIISTLMSKLCNYVKVCLDNTVTGAYKGKEHSTFVFAIVISKSKVRCHVLLLLGTWPFFAQRGSLFPT